MESQLSTKKGNILVYDTTYHEVGVGQSTSFIRFFYTEWRLGKINPRRNFRWRRKYLGSDATLLAEVGIGAKYLQEMTTTKNSNTQRFLMVRMFIDIDFVYPNKFQ